MDQWNDEILPAVMAVTKRDPEHQDRLAYCLELEEPYTILMESMPPEQRQIIDAYLFAYTQVNFRMIHPAYLCGLSKGSVRVITD